MIIADFLRLVWPDGEHYFVVEAVDGRMSHHHATNIEDAASRIAWLDTRAEGNLYYAMASYIEEEYVDAKGTRKRRTQENVDKLKCFWIDLDCKGKVGNYADQREAVLDIRRLCDTTGLQSPTILVSSGYGVHAYWVLEESISAAEWQGVATRWRATLDAHSVRHDSSCTTDSARILRPIGTHNRKAGKEAQEVNLIGPARPLVTLSDFTSKLLDASTTSGFGAPPMNYGADMSLNDAAVAGAEHRPSSILEIVKECGLLRAVGKAGGNVSEPLWHKVLGVVRYTVEAAKAIHIFSKGHPDYNPADTQDKADSWNADGPPSCEMLRRDSMSEMPEHCLNCKHYGSIKNPLQLGYKKILMVEQAVIKTSTGFIEGPVEVASLPPAMHSKFKWESEKLWRNVVDKEGSKGEAKPVFEWITFCDFLFYPSSYYRDVTDKQQTVWTLREREGVFKEFELTGGSMGAGGVPLFKELGERGVTASSGGVKVHMEAYITEWVNSLKKEKVGIETYMHYGWHEDSFLHGTKMHRPDGTSETVRVGGDAANMAKYFSPTGDLDRWVKLIDQAYNHPNSEQYQFIIGSGFGSILMPFMNVAGGTVLSAVSYSTGQGKTTAMRSAFGIYGCPDENTPVTLSRSSVTHKGIFAVAGLLHNFPVLVDETTNIDGGELSDIVYTWSQGQPRIRLTSTGELAPVRFGWSGFLLSSSNKPMTGLIAGAKPGADAELARIIEFDCSTAHKIDKALADEVFSELREHYGVAGDVYLQWVVANQDEVRRMLVSTQLMLDKKIALSGENRYWSAGYATIVVGLMIAKRLGLISFDIKGVVSWIEQQVHVMRGEISTSTSTPTELFGAMLTEVSQGLIVTDIEGGRGAGGKEAWVVKEPRGQYTGRVILSLGIAYISQPAVRKWCIENQVDVKAVMQAGFEAGWVHSTNTTKYYPGKGTNFAMGQTNCFTLDWARLGNSTHISPELAKVVQMTSKGGK